MEEIVGRRDTNFVLAVRLHVSLSSLTVFEMRLVRFCSALFEITPFFLV